MVLSVILATIAAVMIIEGLLVVIFQKQIIKAFMNIKKKKSFGKLGAWEIFIGVVVLVIAIILGVSF
jgi:hypothetical protein